jgi:hypothetical protein
MAIALYIHTYVSCTFYTVWLSTFLSEVLGKPQSLYYDIG